MNNFIPLSCNIFTYFGFKELENKKYIDISLNEKIGDMLIFQYSRLPGLKKIFKEVHVFSPVSQILSQQDYHTYKLKLDELDLESVALSIFGNIKKIKGQRFVFFDTGSIRMFLEKGLKISDPIEVRILSIKFLIEIKTFLQDEGVQFLFWRNPTQKIMWGTENFSFSHDGISFSEILSIKDDFIRKNTSLNPNVYEVSRIINIVFLGTKKVESLLPSDLNIKSKNIKTSSEYIIINLNTGDQIKRKGMEKVFSKILYNLETELCLSGKKLFISRMDEYWPKTMYGDFLKFIQNSKHKIEVFSYEETTKEFYINCKLGVSICSGFSHIFNIFNKKNLTFHLSGTNNEVAGKNLWAPQESILVETDSRADESLKKLCNKINSLL